MAKSTSFSREPENSCTIAVGLLGAGFIGQMHALALRNAATSMWEPKIQVRPKILAEVDSELCAKVGERFDWEEGTGNWVVLYWKSTTIRALTLKSRLDWFSRI